MFPKFLEEFQIHSSRPIGSSYSENERIQTISQQSCDKDEFKYWKKVLQAARSLRGLKYPPHGFTHCLNHDSKGGIIGEQFDPEAKAQCYIGFMKEKEAE